MFFKWLKLKLWPTRNRFDKLISIMMELLTKQSELISKQNIALEEVKKSISELESKMIKKEENALCELNRAEERLKEQGEILRQGFEEELDVLKINFDKQKKELDAYKKELTEDQSCLNDKLNKIDSQLEECRNGLADIEKSNIDNNRICEEIRGFSKLSQKSSKEGVWADTFHDSIVDSQWLRNKAFYPGRWAAGYPFLYALYRALNDAVPKSILELGLGQTTRLISQYAGSRNDVDHIVIEHDRDWADYFDLSFTLSSSTELRFLDVKYGTYKEDEEVLVYDGFSKALEGNKFDLISIDGPIGANARIYSRIDVLSIIPECLNERFAIFMDDCDRPGEQKTIREIQKKLDAAGIQYKTGRFSGEKDTCIIASDNGWGFLTSV